MRGYVPFAPAFVPTRTMVVNVAEFSQFIIHFQAKHLDLLFVKSKKVTIYITHTHLMTPHMWMLMLYCHRHYFFITVHKLEDGPLDPYFAVSLAM